MLRATLNGLANTTARVAALRTRLAIKRVHLRLGAWSRLGAPPTEFTARQRVLAVVTHLVTQEGRTDATRRAIKTARLRETLRGLRSSLAHTETRIIINTVGDNHVVSDLPAWARGELEVFDHPAPDPMWIEARVLDLFADVRSSYDWFLFLEDDLVLHDSTWLEKLAWFNHTTSQPRLLLLPHRYEFSRGQKYYIDLRWTQGFKPTSWMTQSEFTLGGLRFGQCCNPHAACHCLSREQLDLWLASPRRLQFQTVGAGPLESAATFALMEAFELYKPAPSNLHYLEIEHWDRRYSEVLASNDEGHLINLPPSALPTD